MAGELRVEHLVGPRAEGRRPFHPFEEVRDPAPAVEHEHGLVDVLRARPHRRGRARCRLLEVAFLAELDRDDLASLREERVHEGRLVLLPLALAQIVEGIHVVRFCDLAARRRDLELRQVLAADEVTEIGRREAEGFPVELHVSSIRCRSARSYDERGDRRGTDPGRQAAGPTERAIFLLR